MIEIWHCTDPMAMASSDEENKVRWQEHREQYVEVAELETEDLDRAFARTQHLDANWTTDHLIPNWPEHTVRWVRSFDERSSSVGDVFVRDGTPWLVTFIGYQSL